MWFCFTALFCFAADPCNSMTLKDGMEYLIPQLDIFIMDGEKLQCFSDILKAIKNVDSAHTSMISEVIQICVLIHVNPATSASGERSFSTARRIKS